MTTDKHIVKLAQRLRRAAWGRRISPALVKWDKCQFKKEWLRLAEYVDKNFRKRRSVELRIVPQPTKR